MTIRRTLSNGILLFMLAWPVHAQDSDAIDEIQVTATRRPTDISDTPSALTLIAEEKIRSNKLATDALQAEPGIFLQQTTPGQGAAIIRGLKGSEVLHLVDGLRLNNAIFRNAPTQYLALVAPGGVERIEVVRGAPASLYGSDAVGGVIQVLSRLPRFDTGGLRGEAFLAYDLAEQGRIARAAIEAGNERFAGLVSGEYLDVGHRRVGGGERIVPSDYRSKGGRLAVALRPDDASSWLVDLQFAEQPSTPRVDELVPGFGQTVPSSSEFEFMPNSRAFAHLRHTRDDWFWNADWVFDAGWQRITDDRVTRNFASPVRRREENSSDLFGLTASASSETEQGSWVVGAELYHDRVDSSRVSENIVSGITQPVLSRFPDGSTVDQAAIYGSLLRRAAELHSFSGGLRFSAISVDIPSSPTSDHKDLSADLGWLFDATERTQLMANLGYGFRAPNVFDLGTLGERPGNRFNIPNPTLESERITQFDFGVRQRAETYSLEFSVFALHYRDRIASVPTGAVTPDGREVVQSQNVESADIRGIESALQFALSQQLTADLVINYVYGEQSESGGSDQPADRIPPLNGLLSLRYEASDQLTIEPFLRFAGEQDRLSDRDAGDPRVNPAGTPGWVTLNVAAIWQTAERWEATARLDNVLDQNYRWHGSGIDAPGRSLYLSLLFNW